MTISNSLKRLNVWRLVEGIILTLVVIGMLATIASLVYQHSVGRARREFSGKIVDKRIQVYESNEGSWFVHQLIVLEKKSTNRLPVTVTQEMYDKAKIGMGIRRTQNGIELLPNSQEDPPN